jgi:hypothetical protein
MTGYLTTRTWLSAGEEVQEKKLEENYAPASYLLSLADFKASLSGSKPLLVREGNSITS